MYYVKNKKIIVFHVEFFLHKIPIVLLQIFVDTVKQIKTYCYSVFIIYNLDYFMLNRVIHPKEDHIIGKRKVDIEPPLN
jgi:hypothetical protein